MSTYQHLSALYHAHPAINTLISLLIGSAITYSFTRMADNRKIKIEKSETAYNLLQELLFSLHDMHILPQKLNLLTEDQLTEELESYLKNIESKSIYIDFLLNCYLKPYKNFYNAFRSIHQYRQKRKELGTLAFSAANSRDPTYFNKRKQYYDDFDALKKVAEDGIMETMQNIKIDTANMFFINKVKRIWKWTSCLILCAFRGQSTRTAKLQ